ncbi:MAG TPA: metallophosphoesterase [Gemmatimonadaceae bacterium]|nr:metallophosphoesterase [Gemmatimonadaceae bacterium]
MPVAILLSACSRGEQEPTRAPSKAGIEEAALAGGVVMIGAGDIAVCDKNRDEETAQLVDSLLTVEDAAKTQSVVVTIGDNAYPSGSRGVDEDFPRCFSPSWGKGRIMERIHPSPGNHDYDSGSLQPYIDFFGKKVGPNGSYYSFDVGEWHVISLDSELYYLDDDHKRQHAQEEWLHNDLGANRKPCALAYFHRPRFSSGEHGDTHRMKALWDELYAAGADVILNGHEHHYERFAPQNPDGRPDPKNGIVEFIVGTGGAALRGVDEIADNSVAHIHGRYGVLKLTLGQGAYQHAFIDTDGRVWDVGTGRCH